MICKHCKKEIIIQENDKFCYECGKPLYSNEENINVLKEDIEINSEDLESEVAKKLAEEKMKRRVDEEVKRRLRQEQLSQTKEQIREHSKNIFSVIIDCVKRPYDSIENVLQLDSFTAKIYFFAMTVLLGLSSIFGYLIIKIKLLFKTGGLEYLFGLGGLELGMLFGIFIFRVITALLVYGLIITIIYLVYKIKRSSVKFIDFIKASLIPMSLEFVLVCCGILITGINIYIGIIIFSATQIIVFINLYNSIRNVIDRKDYNNYIYVYSFTTIILAVIIAITAYLVILESISDFFRYIL